MYSCSAYNYLLRWSHRRFYGCVSLYSETFNLCLIESLPAFSTLHFTLSPISWPFLVLQEGSFRRRSREMWLWSCMYFLPFCVVILNFLSNLLQLCRRWYMTETPSWSHSAGAWNFVGKRLGFRRAAVLFCFLQVPLLSCSCQADKDRYSVTLQGTFTQSIFRDSSVPHFLALTPAGDEMGQSGPGCFDSACTGGYRQSEMHHSRDPFFIPELPLRKCTFLFLSHS